MEGSRQVSPAVVSENLSRAWHILTTGRIECWKAWVRARVIHDAKAIELLPGRCLFPLLLSGASLGRREAFTGQGDQLSFFLRVAVSAQTIICHEVLLL